MVFVSILLSLCLFIQLKQLLKRLYVVQILDSGRFNINHSIILNKKHIFYIFKLCHHFVIKSGKILKSFPVAIIDSSGIDLYFAFCVLASLVHV